MMQRNLLNFRAKPEARTKNYREKELDRSFIWLFKNGG